MESQIILAKKPMTWIYDLKKAQLSWMVMAGVTRETTNQVSSSKDFCHKKAT